MNLNRLGFAIGFIAVWAIGLAVGWAVIILAAWAAWSVIS